MKQLGQGYIAQALVRALGLRGRYQPGADEILSPVITSFNADVSPYSRFAKPCAAIVQQGAGGVGTKATVGVQAGAGTILQVHRVAVENTSGGAFRIVIGIMTAAEVAANFTSAGTQNLVDLNAASTSAGALPTLAAFLNFGTYPTGLFNFRAIVDTTFPADSGQVFFDMPPRTALHGEDPQGSSMIFALADTANVPISRCAFHCSEWPAGF